MESNSKMISLSIACHRKFCRWVKSHERVVPCLKFNVDSLPLNEWKILSLSNAYAKFKLQRVFAKSEIGPTMDMAEFVKVIRLFKNEEFRLRNAQYEIQSNDFERIPLFNDEVICRVSHFYDFSKLTADLLEISIELDEENSLDSRDTREMIRRKCFEMENFVLRDGEKREITAALFLAERIVNCTEMLIKSVPRKMFFPVHRSVLAMADDTFHKFSAKVSSLIDLIYLQIWHHSEVSGLRVAIFQKFSSAVQSSVKKWIHENLNAIVSSSSANCRNTAVLDELCALIDELWLSIAKFGERYETFFERVSISYVGKVLNGIDDSLCVACRQCLAESLSALNSRDAERLLDFTSSSMKLFDALGELSELTKNFGVECEIREFETWFVEPAIFWSTSWRFVYMDFVRKCIEQATFSEELFRRPSSSCQDGHSQLQGRRRLSTDSKNFRPHLPSATALATEDYFFAAMASQRFDDGVQMHESTVNCLAFCKALCDDFLRLRSQNSSILLLGLLQVTAILVDCLGSFVVQLVHQIKRKSNCFRMIEAANGIEHASSYLAKNFERFLEARRLAELVGGEAERTQALSTVRHMMGSARARCRAIADQIIDGICAQKIDKLRRNCSVITRNYKSISEIIPTRRKLETYFRHVFNANEPADELLGYLDRTCRNLHKILLERLYSTARQTLWRHIQRIIEEQLLQGLSPKYYEEIDSACESICHLLNAEWVEEQSSLRRKLHVNRAETVDLILQYYSELCDMTMTSSMMLNDVSRRKFSHQVDNRISWKCTGNDNNLSQPTSSHQSFSSPLRTITSPSRKKVAEKRRISSRICLRVGYIRSTNQQILLHVHVLRAYDIPILDTLTQSSDPYLRLELYPRCLFPLLQFVPQNTETKKQTLNPRWNEIFQILVPEKYFFLNGVCLCITILDHDIVSYNDLAGQAFLPLSTVSRLDSLCAESMPVHPQILPLAMPARENRNSQTFQILEQRSQRRDPLARELVEYEKYLYNYRILPPSALDTKESTLNNSLSLAGSRQLILQAFSDLFTLFNNSR